MSFSSRVFGKADNRNSAKRLWPEFRLISHSTHGSSPRGGEESSAQSGCFKHTAASRNFLPLHDREGRGLMLLLGFTTSQGASSEPALQRLEEFLLACVRVPTRFHA